MTDLTPAQIIADAPLGAVIRFSNGEPQPPARFHKKLSAWKHSNDLGTLVEVSPEQGTFTLHAGDLGSGGVIVMRVYRTFDVATRLSFTLERAATPGAILCASVWAGKRKIDKVTDEPGGQAWLRNNVYGELLRVREDGGFDVVHASAREAA